MTDEPKAQETPVKETQDAAMPATEQKTPSSTEGAPAQEVPQQTKEEGLPESASERTKREFDKLQTQLREERTRREAVEAAFQSMQPKSQPPPVYDPETGMLNEQVLTDVQRSAYEAKERADKAEQMVQGYLNEQEKQKVHAVHPEIDPENKEKFNQSLYGVTSAIMLDSMVHPDNWGGKELSFMEAAEKAKEVTSGAAKQAKEEGAREAMEQLTPKEQASLAAVGATSRHGEALGDLDELRRRSRKGDAEATIERLRRITTQE